jgi:catechol 2,3-dioxygenase-like lactoylglutathione lyase family enzyme
MDVKCIAGFSAITKDPAASASLYQDALGLPLEAMDDYHFMDRFPGANHFGVWPLGMAAQSCFGQDEWPAEFAEPTSTIEFELCDAAAVEAAVCEMKEKDSLLFTRRARSLGGSHRSFYESGGRVDWSKLRPLASRMTASF